MIEGKLMENGKLSISFCTVSMNRADHVVKTLTQNIADNEEYENLEFVILDYNSKDNLETLIRENFSEQLRTGRVKYYKTLTPQFFHRSHSRNLAFKLATGEILCTIDADNYTGKGFAEYVNRKFQTEENILLTAIGSDFNSGSNSVGRLCVRKEDFEAINGYDERMSDYTLEDFDYVSRSELAGVTRRIINDEKFLKSIPHSNLERIENEVTYKRFEKLYFNYLTPYSTSFLLLFNDGLYAMATAVNKYYALDEAQFTFRISAFPSTSPFALLEDSWEYGPWTIEGNNLQLKKDKNTLSFKLDGRYCLQGQSDTFYQITDEELILSSIMFHCGMANKSIMNKSITTKHTRVNENGYGRDIVYKNFNPEPIQIS